MLRCLLLSLLVLLATGPVASAAEPPNQNDPCSRGGRNTCATSGEGSYGNYRHGVRWFGDYRGAVPGVSGATFCIDLRFWYPSRAFGYERRSAAGLRNKEGEAVSTARLRRMSRALWRFGRSDRPARQAAVMLYVHRLMGDGAPGEADPKTLSAASRSIYAQVERDAERFAGPYRVRAVLPGKLVSGRPAELTVEVLAASGRRVPAVEVTLEATGADGLPAKLETGAGGVAKATLRATDPEAGVTLEARAEGLPADLPALYVPTKGEAARNAQRIVSLAVESPRAQVRAAVRAEPALATQISAPAVTPGTAVTDTVRVTGLGSRSATIQAALYGPYAAREQITCQDAPVWTGSVEAAGDGEYVTAPVTLTQPGYYTYRESIAESDTVASVQTACAEVAETTVVRAAPAIATQVSAQETAPGQAITDTAVVTGLGRLGATVNVELWGPFATREAIRCEGTPLWTGTFGATGDGSYVTAPVTLTRAGYYTYRESIAASEAIDGVVTPCGETSETALAKAAPQVATVVSSAVVKPGAEIFDRLTVSGLGQTPATVEVALYGPYSSRADIDCEGAPYWNGAVAVTGDGEYASPKTTLRRAGFYAYRERIAASETVAGAQGECSVEAETSLAAPLILGGRGDQVAQVVAAQVRDVVQPARVRLARLGIDAKVTAIGIDTREGALGLPSDIHRAGWWSDGAAPGASAGTILLAGHIDSAKEGAGAFYALRGARRGDTVQLVSDDGRARRYRVTTRRSVRKAALPARIYSRSGPARLVLVTCGGPFNLRTGHYRDNVIVTAAPV